MTDPAPPRAPRLAPWVAGAVLLTVAVTILSFTVLYPTDHEPDPAPPAPADRRPRVVVDDSFDRPEATGRLGGAPGGAVWEEITGVWGTRDGDAVLRRPNPGGPRSIAVVPLGSGDGAVEAVVGALRDGWGLVFRFRGPFNYWSLSIGEGGDAFSLQRVEDGVVQSDQRLTPVSLEAGSAVRVEFDGPAIEVIVDGRSAFTVDDDALDDGTRGGILLYGFGASEATFASFRAEAIGRALAPPVDG